MNPDLQLNTAIPHTARVYDYILGGKDNFKADRELAAKLMTALPSMKLPGRLGLRGRNSAEPRGGRGRSALLALTLIA